PSAETLAQNELGVRNLQVVVELRTSGVLNAMIRPQDLLSVVDRDGLERTFVAMRRRERVVAGRMPILRQHYVPETRGDAIDDRHDLIAARNGKLTARAEVILDIDDQQDVASPTVIVSVITSPPACAPCAHRLRQQGAATRRSPRPDKMRRVRVYAEARAGAQAHAPLAPESGRASGLARDACQLA